MLSDSDRLRLAVALVAVKFKPPDLSFESYVLDLRSRFPPSTPLAPDTDNPWRTRAILMEKNCTELQAKYEAEKIKSLAAEEVASSLSKKKGKKKSSGTEPSETARAPEKRPKDDGTGLNSLLKKLHDQINIPAIPLIAANDSILPSLNSVLQLMSIPDPQPALVLSATIRTIEAIANVLKAIISRSTPNVPSEIDTLKMLNIISYHMLDTVIPRILSSPGIPRPLSPLGSATPDVAIENPIDILLERISTLILNPMIFSFYTLSQTFIGTILAPLAAGNATNATAATSAGGTKPPGHNSGQPEAIRDPPADVRGDALSLFSIIFRALSERLQDHLARSPNLRLSLHTLQASLVLETVREFERFSTSVPVNSLPSGPGGNTDDPVDVSPISRDMRTPAMRVRRLAIKDARWYMCTILHTVFSDLPETSSVAYAPLTVSITPGNSEATGEIPDEAEARRIAQANSGRLLNEGISDALHRLVTKCKKTASSQCHDETQASESVIIRGEVLDIFERQEGRISHEQHQGRVDDRKTPPDITTNGSQPGKSEVQSAISDKGLDVGAKTGPALDVGVNPGGPLVTQSGKAQGDASVPLGFPSGNSSKRGKDNNTIDLDDIEHNMLLGVIERYWVWSESHKY